MEDPEADWRLDVYTGSCRLPVLINEYLTARSDMVDEYHKDGIAAGSPCTRCPVLPVRNGAKLFWISGMTCGMPSYGMQREEAVTFLGGATGLYCGYLDFIAWDLPAVLTAAQAIL